MRRVYERDFFAHQSGGLRSARRMLPVVFDVMRPRTLIDVGCGIGAWASVAKELGCEVKGVDGDWVPRDQLLIGIDEFEVVNLSNPPRVTRRFDMATSLEVGEHLAETAARPFVQFLTALAPCVLFSAAIPYQVGTHHINEQFPTYWAKLFDECGFAPFDVIRPRCWHDRDIQFFYRQNTLLFVHQSMLPSIAGTVWQDQRPLDIVHPDAVPILAQGWVDTAGAMQCASFFLNAVRRSFGRRLSALYKNRSE